MDVYQLSAQIQYLTQRLDALEGQVATLSRRLGVPFTPAGSGAAADPRLATSADPRAAEPVFDPLSAVLSPVPPPSGPGPVVGAPAVPGAAGVPPEVVALARQGKKIQAIKLYRELTNVGLKTAKDVVDNL